MTIIVLCDLQGVADSVVCDLMQYANHEYVHEPRNRDDKRSEECYEEVNIYGPSEQQGE